MKHYKPLKDHLVIVGLPTLFLPFCRGNGLFHGSENGPVIVNPQLRGRTSESWSKNRRPFLPSRLILPKTFQNVLLSYGGT